MTLYKWSQTASSDATADPTINWAEGQAPSSVNDSARAMMAAIAKYRDDMSGVIQTSGTATNYTLASYQQFDSLADMDGKVIAFTPHVTNASGPLLSVDNLPQQGIVAAIGSPSVQAGVLVQGTPYVAVYSKANGCFVLQGFYGNPYNVPLAAGMDYWGTTAPNSSFAFPFGQAISRTTYASLFSLIGTTYGGGDGSTTFNLPDLRGRVVAALDNMGGSQAGRLNVSWQNALGGNGGESFHTLDVSEIPPHNHLANVSDPGHSHVENLPYPGPGNTYPSTMYGNGSGIYMNPEPPTQTAYTGLSVSIGNQGGGAAHNNLQPTIVCNYIVRII
jgi:microcystin-dependent protein